jgi:hypothetical protein
MNPAVLTAFALAIAGDAQGPAYPGIPGHEPSVVAGRKAAERVDRCMSHLRALRERVAALVSDRLVRRTRAESRPSNAEGSREFESTSLRQAVLDYTDSPARSAKSPRLRGFRAIGRTLES